MDLGIDSLNESSSSIHTKTVTASELPLNNQNSQLTAVVILAAEKALVLQLLFTGYFFEDFLDIGLYALINPLNIDFTRLFIAHTILFRRLNLLKISLRLKYLIIAAFTTSKTTASLRDIFKHPSHIVGITGLTKAVAEHQLLPLQRLISTYNIL